ncbi:hypothetical protein WA026_012691 [Henosepilachna vigintioctopunctata]|uniref:Uncharacterized protein n=1 Tax=Henosepilachna vigintioctopunctata TaxID=420089 RepID=A0AAW1U8I1_9CUCU
MIQRGGGNTMLVKVVTCGYNKTGMIRAVKNGTRRIKCPVYTRLDGSLSLHVGISQTRRPLISNKADILEMPTHLDRPSTEFHGHSGILVQRATLISNKLPPTPHPDDVRYGANTNYGLNGG